MCSICTACSGVSTHHEHSLSRFYGSIWIFQSVSFASPWTRSFTFVRPTVWVCCEYVVVLSAKQKRAGQAVSAITAASSPNCKLTSKYIMKRHRWYKASKMMQLVNWTWHNMNFALKSKMHWKPSVAKSHTWRLNRKQQVMQWLKLNQSKERMMRNLISCSSVITPQLPN